MALTQGWVETGAVVVALAIGAAYSLPPIRLKRHAVAASLCIAGVRSAVVNLGVAVHFSKAFGGSGEVPGAVWALCLFVLPFSFAIAVLKDVPDGEGDRAFRIATFTIRLGARRAAWLGLGALGLAYAGMAIAGPIALPEANAWVLAGGHLAAARPARLVGVPRRSRRPARLHALLHARLGAVLPRVPAGAGGGPGRVTLS